MNRVPLREDSWPADHPDVPHGMIGVLLVNLGTPDGVTYWPMRRYLKEFLSDRRVIETNRVLWWFILNGPILTFRPKKSGRAYASIWNNERNEGPLRTITRSQADRLAQRFLSTPRIVVDWAMRYGNPSIEDRLKSLHDQGCERLLVMPLYPQYCAATTATVNDKVFESLSKMRWQPALRTLPPYHDEPLYIDGLARSVETHLASLPWEPERVLASYHGIPQSYFRKGDPYHCHCMKTSRLLRERLGWDEDRLITTFQSRFGPEAWLQPYTDKTIEAFAQEGVKKLAVITPGFSADCLETLEEIAGEGEEIFHKAGGEVYSHIPCLNDSDDSLGLLEHLVRRELSGWL